MGEATLTEWERKNEVASQKIQQLLRILSKSKMLHVLYALGTKDGSLRFSEIKKLSFTDSTTLTRRPAELEDIAMISRNVVSTNPPVVEYQLTESFSTIKPILEDLLHYGLEGANNES